MRGQLIYPPESCPHPLHRIAAATSTAPAQCTACGTIEPDAKAVDSARAEAQVIEAQLRRPDAKAGYSGVTLDTATDAKAVDSEPGEAGESLGDFVQRALGVALTAPMRPTEPPVVSPRLAAELYADAARTGEEWPGLYEPPMIGRSWLDGFVRNSFVLRAEVPPAPGSERAAELERAAAERKATARRRGARRVARVARQRARGIRPCSHDCDRGDDW